MASNAIDQILESRRAAATKLEEVAEADTGKFYSISIVEGVQEHFIEVRFNNGVLACFAYQDIQWFNYDPEDGRIDIEINGYKIVIRGRGLGGRVFQAIKQKRLSWVKEADSGMEDHAGNDIFVEEITITPPEGFEDEDAAA